MRFSTLQSPFNCQLKVYFMYITNFKPKIIKYMCGLKLPRDQHQSTILLQLTGKWQYVGIMWLTLRSVKSINVEFLNQILYFSIKYVPNCSHDVELPGIEPTTPLSVVGHADPSGIRRSISNNIPVKIIKLLTGA